jgi:hypothetical protein
MSVRADSRIRGARRGLIGVDRSPRSGAIGRAPAHCRSGVHEALKRGARVQRMAPGALGASSEGSPCRLLRSINSVIDQDIAGLRPGQRSPPRERTCPRGAKSAKRSLREPWRSTPPFGVWVPSPYRAGLLLRGALVPLRTPPTGRRAKGVRNRRVH